MYFHTPGKIFPHVSDVLFYKCAFTCRSANYNIIYATPPADLIHRSGSSYVCKNFFVLAKKIYLL